MSCGVGDKCGSDPVLLWLWCLPVAVIPFQPLSWEFSYAMGGPKLEEKKKKKSSVWVPLSVLSTYFFFQLLPFQTNKKKMAVLTAYGSSQAGIESGSFNPLLQGRSAVI